METRLTTRHRLHGNGCFFIAVLLSADEVDVNRLKNIDKIQRKTTMPQFEEAPRSVPPVLPPPVPPGLPELMEGLSREVMRHNPEDIYAFCAQHMEKLLKIREELNPTEKPMLKSKTPLTLEQNVEKTQNLVRIKSEEHHKQYSKAVSPAMIALNEKPGKAENANEVENQTFNGYDEVFVDEKAKYNKDEDVPVAAKSTENNEGIVEEKLAQKIGSAKKENMSEGKEVEDNNVKKESLIVKRTVEEQESNENKSISEDSLVGEKEVVGNESINKAGLDDEEVTKENYNVNKESLVENITQDIGNIDKENMIEVHGGKIVNGNESENNKNSVEKIEDLYKKPVQETKRFNADSVQGNSDENGYYARLGKETFILKGNENIVKSETANSFVDKNTIEDNERNGEHTKKISQISENFINNIVDEGTNILTKSKPVEESIVEPQKSEIFTSEDKRIDEKRTSIQNESADLNNSLKNVTQECEHYVSNQITEEIENLPATPTVEEKLSLTKEKESLDKNTGNENSRESEAVDGKPLTKLNTSVAQETENCIENGQIGDILHVHEPALTIDDHNEAMVNEHIIDKKITSVEESTPGKIKMEEANVDKIKDDIDHMANNTIVEVNSNFLSEIATEEKSHLNDGTTTEEIKTLDTDDTEKKSENMDDISVNDTKDLAINKIIDGVVQMDEIKETESSLSEVKSGNLVADNSKENKQLDSEITAKESEEFGGCKINGSLSHNEDAPIDSHNKVIKTEIVEVLEPFIDSIKGSGELLNQNSSTKEDVEIETNISEKIITNDTKGNMVELDGVGKTERESKENDVQVVAEEDSNIINVTENITAQRYTTENEVKNINETSIDENEMNDNGVNTNSIQMNNGAVHESTKSDTENSNNTIEIGTIISQNVPGRRNKQSIEEKDKQNNLELENDHIVKERDIENNIDGSSKEENEKLENADNFESPIENKESTTYKNGNAENDKNTISDEIQTQTRKVIRNNENETSNDKEQIDVIHKGKSAPDIVDSKILQNNAELMILSHAEGKNNSEDKNTDIKPYIYDTKGQSEDNPNTENYSESQKCVIEAKSENRESTETTGDEQIHDSSDEKSSPAEEDPNISLQKDDNKILNTSESMDLETAAITMQKAFQAFLFESTASNSEDNDNGSLDISESGSNNTPESGEHGMDISKSQNERPPGILTRANTVLQTVNEEKSLSLSTDESSGLSSAATVIQAHVRGFLVRNRLSSNKFTSSDTPANSVEAMSEDLPRVTSAKTVLKINIPEQENFSIGDSIDTSVDLPIDPVPSVVNLHPLGYDKDARKPLKREDAIQSISPPSNSSTKLSEEANSPPGSSVEETTARVENNTDESNSVINHNEDKTTTVIDTNYLKIATETSNESKTTTKDTKKVLTRASSDETDVVTPFKDCGTPHLLHSSEFHDILLPTQVVRKDSSVVREFKCALAYFMKWHST